MKSISDSALIIVDVQNDFCTGGPLEIYGAENIIPVINSLVPLFCKIVYTQDCHPENHISFSKSPEFKDKSWPQHCVMNTYGVQIHNYLIVDENAVFLKKGTNPGLEQYSVFDKTGLGDLLKSENIYSVYIAGLATDYCVRYSAIDAAKEGFSVNVVMDACAGISDDTVRETIEDFKKNNVRMVNASEIIDMVLAHK